MIKVGDMVIGGVGEVEARIWEEFPRKFSNEIFWGGGEYSWQEEVSGGFIIW